MPSALLEANNIDKFQQTLLSPLDNNWKKPAHSTCAQLPTVVGLLSIMIIQLEGASVGSQADERRVLKSYDNLICHISSYGKLLISYGFPSSNMLRQLRLDWLDPRFFKQHRQMIILHTWLFMDHQHPCPPTAGLDFSAVSPGPFAAPPAYSLQLALEFVSQFFTNNICTAVHSCPQRSRLWP